MYTVQVSVAILGTQNQTKFYNVHPQTLNPKLQNPDGVVGAKGFLEVEAP